MISNKIKWKEKAGLFGKVVTMVLSFHFTTGPKCTYTPSHALLLFKSNTFLPFLLYNQKFTSTHANDITCDHKQNVHISLLSFKNGHPDNLRNM